MKHTPALRHSLLALSLGLAALPEGGQDASAYALQVGEVQERILGSTFGDDVDGQRRCASGECFDDDFGRCRRRWRWRFLAGRQAQGNETQ